MEETMVNLTRLRHIAKAMRDEVRLLIITYLRKYTYLSFQQLVDITRKSKSTVSHHIAQLVEAGIIEETEVDNPDHHLTKYYRFCLDDREFDLPTELETDTQKIELLEMFEYGRSYLKLQKELLDVAISSTDSIYHDLIQVLQTGSDRTEEQEEFVEEGMDFIQQLITSSKFITFPVNRAELSEYVGGLIEYNNQFLKKMGQRDYAEQEDLHWIIEASLPLDHIMRMPKPPSD